MIVASDATTSRLRIAVPKGVLFDGSVGLLSEAGIDASLLADAGRRLIVRGDGIDYVIGRPTDIPAYVAYGAVDCGIAGKDSLVEAALDVVELVDLRFGGCKFVVAEPGDAAGLARDRYRHLGVVRVATKYPGVTERHFASKGVQVEIVKLHGNIELAPLLGLAEQIVDITATGQTLASNGLRVVEEVLASTARFVANPVALRLKSEQISTLADRLESVVAAEGRLQ